MVDVREIDGAIAISIHALLAESDHENLAVIDSFFEFLSTLSLRRATYVVHHLNTHVKYFYPRSPCGERQLTLSTIKFAFAFLSTLSLRRATLSRASRLGEHPYFYPRSPCGERRIT